MLGRRNLYFESIREAEQRIVRLGDVWIPCRVYVWPSPRSLSTPTPATTYDNSSILFCVYGQLFYLRKNAVTQRNHLLNSTPIITPCLLFFSSSLQIILEVCRAMGPVLRKDSLESPGVCVRRGSRGGGVVGAGGVSWAAHRGYRSGEWGWERLWLVEFFRSRAGGKESACSGWSARVETPRSVAMRSLVSMRGGLCVGGLSRGCLCTGRNRHDDQRRTSEGNSQRVPLFWTRLARQTPRPL